MIAQVRLAQVLKKVEKLCSKLPAASTDLARNLRVALQERSAEQLLNGMQNLLCETLLKGQTEQDDSVFVSATAGAEMANDHQAAASDQQELMFHLGSDDGITKGDILQYLTKSNILKGRAFVMVPARISEELLHSFKGQALLGKRVRVTYA